MVQGIHIDRNVQVQRLMMQTPPGWLPQNDATVDPQLKTDLNEVKEHPPTQNEYMPKIVEKLKECYDPEISVDIYNLGDRKSVV